MSYENSAQPEYSAPPPPKPEPVYQPAAEEPDGYGIPSAPVVSYEPEQPVYSGGTTSEKNHLKSVFSEVKWKFS